MALPIFLLTLPHMRFMWGFSFRCHRLTALAAFCWTRARVYAGGFFFMCTLRIVILRTVNRRRTAPTVRLSLSAIILGLFPASTISRNCLSSSGSQRRSLAFFALWIISQRRETHDPSQAFQWRGPRPACPAQQLAGLVFDWHCAVPCIRR